MPQHFYESTVEYITHLIVNLYRNRFLIEGFFIFLTVFVKGRFEKRAQFASPNALENNLHIERNRLRVASLEERIERVWSSETSKGVF